MKTTFTITLTPEDGKRILTALWDNECGTLRFIDKIGKEAAREYGFTDELRELRRLYTRISDAMDANGLND